MTLALEHQIIAVEKGRQGAGQTVPEDLVCCAACGWKRCSDYALHLDDLIAAEKAKAWNEGHEACALRIPEGVWADTAARHPGNPYQRGSDDE